MISDSSSQVKSSLPVEVRAAAACGWKLFPIVAGAKTPLVKWGTTEPASSDLDQITRWAMKYPNCNWGCATGSKSGLFVVDTDNCDGWLWAMSKGLPPTHTVKTGKDDNYAYHYYFKLPAGMRIKNSQKKIHSGVDVRGDGGLVVIPPSLHHSGNRYQLETAASWELAEAPEWLIELIKDDTPERPAVDLNDLPPLTPDQIQHGQNIFRKRCREFAALPAGTGTNLGLHHFVAALLRDATQGVNWPGGSSSSPRRGVYEETSRDYEAVLG
jgi:Bifunctional DNA primase/polymerase, N-terminal